MIRADETPEEIVDDLVAHAESCFLRLYVVHQRADERAAAHPLLLPSSAGLSVARDVDVRR